jgi:flagellar protein FlbD
MIELTRINGEKICINAEQIETVETTFDTVITLCSGKKISVAEPAEEITNRVIDYKKKLLQ